CLGRIEHRVFVTNHKILFGFRSGIENLQVQTHPSLGPWRPHFTRAQSTPSPQAGTTASSDPLQPPSRSAPPPLACPPGTRYTLFLVSLPPLLPPPPKEDLLLTFGSVPLPLTVNL